MANSTTIHTIETLVEALLQPHEGYFLAQVSIKPGNHVEVLLDADQGVSISTCTQISRELAKQIEEQQILPPENYSLEVGSHGIGSPLLKHRQYIKNMGRLVTVLLNDGKVLEGDLANVSETGIELKNNTGKGKKAVTEIIPIDFKDIKTTTVEIKF